MKLLVITTSYPPHQVGGYEVRCGEVIEGLKQRGHAVRVLTQHCPDRYCALHSHETHVARILHRKTRLLYPWLQFFQDCLDLRQIEREIQTFQPDLVYLWDIQNLSSLILPYLSYQKYPLVYDEGDIGLIYLTKIHRRGVYFYRFEQDSFLKRLLKTGFDRLAERIYPLIHTRWSWPPMGILFNSHSAMAFAREMGVDVERARVIHSGVNLSRFTFKEREKLTEPITVLMPGRIKPEKRTVDGTFFLEALLKQGISARLKIVGHAGDRDYFNWLLHEIAQKGLSEYVDICSPVPWTEMVGLYHEADFCFFPSLFRKGFSRTPLEAMAAGCVVLTYGNEGSAEVIKSGETGLIVSPGDFEAAVLYISNLLADPVEYQKTIMRARQDVEQYYALEKYIDQVEQFLIGVLTQYSNLQ